MGPTEVFFSNSTAEFNQQGNDSTIFKHRDPA